MIGLRAVLLALVGLAVMASPAGADPPAPGDYTSRITEVDPDVDGFEVSVIGGDSFLEVVAEPGVEVVVLGYDDEPYIRVDADGTVERNDNSPATYLNDDRYARIDVPPHLVGVDAAELTPEWTQVGDGGSYAWHDHRIHWMAPDSPPSVERGGTFGWSGSVPLVVDGERVDVNGEITFEPDVAAALWIGVAVVAAGALLFGLRNRLRVLTVVGAVIAAAGVYVAWATYALSPADVGASWTPVAVIAVGVAFAVAAVVVSDKVRPIPALAAASALAGWAILRFGVLTNPVLPTNAPPAVDRAVTALALSVAVALALVGLRSIAPVLDDADGGDDPVTE